ncbi:uncharacterized protein EI90DRAFT_3056803 [Cantharellus anzutake]|uniref:uncharacterized protein n=1 Tax=Cantharellus anzutake TaxID=1750568 RepID=UPI0019057BB1|nr:uncharacterized protein EI90DRAFT_3056803 [Cantharellus anzutake]KAF8331651.1 hypothetical protein EI90DRAFT_3056803 [Cantharellus anzutake]
MARGGAWLVIMELCLPLGRPKSHVPGPQYVHNGVGGTGTESPTAYITILPVFHRGRVVGSCTPGIPYIIRIHRIR